MEGDVEASLRFLEQEGAAAAGGSGSEGEGEGGGQDARVEALLARARLGKALRRPLTAQEPRERVAQLLEARRGGGEEESPEGAGGGPPAPGAGPAPAAPSVAAAPAAASASAAAVVRSASPPLTGGRRTPAQAPRGRPQSARPAASGTGSPGGSGLSRTTSGGRHSKEAAAAKVEEALRRETPFRPKLSTRTQLLAQKQRRRAGTLSTPGTPAASSGAGSAPEARGAWLQDLSKPRDYEELSRLKQEMENREVMQHSFRPEIHLGPKKAGKGKAAARKVAPGRVMQRLSSSGHDPGTLAKLERLRTERAAREMAECTFKPQIEPSLRQAGPDPAEYVPIHRRVGKVLKERQERLTRARISRELDDPDLTFNPQLNESSIRIAEAKELEEELMFTARLEAGVGGAAPEGGRAGRAVHVTDDDVHCTFQPRISQESDRMVASMSDRDSNFVRRQRLEQRRREEARNEVVHADEHECTFHPRLVAAGAAVHVAEEKRYESLEARINRLAVKDVQSFEVRKKELEQEFYKDCTFEPVTNSRRKAGAGAKRGNRKNPQALEELHRNSRAAKSREKLEKEASERFEAEHTFKPRVVARRSGTAPVGGRRGGEGDDVVPSARLQISVLDSDMVMERIKRYREERERKLREQEDALAREELQHCTFKPRTNPGRGGRAAQKAKGPSLKKMPGMSGFLQQKRRAKEQQEEKMRLEEKIFMTDTSKLGRRSTCTEAKPFRLSNGVGSAQKRRALKQRIHEEELAECTFHPVTNEGRNRELIQRILMTEDSFRSDEGGGH